jgi:hypothetical protein
VWIEPRHKSPEKQKWTEGEKCKSFNSAIVSGREPVRQPASGWRSFGTLKS